MLLTEIIAFAANEVDNGVGQLPILRPAVLSSYNVHSGLYAVLARYFASWNTTSKYPQTDPIVFNSNCIKSIITKLELKPSCGVDGINIKFIHSTSGYSSIILEWILSQSLHNGTAPLDWKTAKIIPIHKPGDAHNSSTWRPISLARVPCMIMEHIIYSQVMDCLEPNNFFTPSQHDFHKTCPWDTQLLCFANDLHSNLDAGFLGDCTFLGLTNAFDKVHPTLLLSSVH